MCVGEWAPPLKLTQEHFVGTCLSNGSWTGNILPCYCENDDGNNKFHSMPIIACNLLFVAEDSSEDERYKLGLYILSGLLLAMAIITVIVVIALISSVASRSSRKIQRQYCLIENENPVYDQPQIKKY